MSEEFDQVSTPPRENVWIHGDNVDEAELRKLSLDYGLDFNILRDVLDSHELPRVEQRGDGLYVFVRTVHRGKHGRVTTMPVLMVVKGTVFVNVSMAGAENRKLATPIILSEARDTTSLLLGTFAAVVGEYEDLMQRTARYIKDTGQRLRTHEVTNRDFVKFVTVEDNLNDYQMNLNGMLVVAQRLREEVGEGSDREAIDDILLYIRQLLVAIDSYNQSINSIRNAYGTIANNVLNKRMKTLTVLTLLVALPNVFYGMFGMNVALPFQNAPWAYAAIVVFTFLLILAIYWVAKRLRLF